MELEKRGFAGDRSNISTEKPEKDLKLEKGFRKMIPPRDSEFAVTPYSLAMRLVEIAKEANVSTATVSRVINSPELVTAEKKRKVLAVLKRHDHKPVRKPKNRGARAKRGAALKIGLWFAGAKRDQRLNWFNQELGNTQATSHGHQIDLRVFFTDSADIPPQQMLQDGLDGAILQGMEPSADCLRRLEEIPHVWHMTRRTPDYPGDYVEPNNEENGRMAADYLHAHGHRDVAVLTTDPDYSAMSLRMRAFLERSRELGLKAVGIHREMGSGISFLNTTELPEELEKLFLRFRGMNPRPTGLYLPTDHFCGFLYRSMRQSGIEPGKDFEVILGNFNSVFYHNLDPLPAAIDINLHTLVRKVIDHLIWRIENRKASGRVGISVSPTLIMPGTTEIST